VELPADDDARIWGDFLEEDLYEDWAVGPREHARATYLAVVRALIELAAARGDHEHVIHCALRLLERDPYDECAHLAVVGARTAAKAHGEARRAYRLYQVRMAELDVVPAPFPSAASRAGSGSFVASP
jgi:DNA-binding SARP family transcriptional activator